MNEKEILKKLKALINHVDNSYRNYSQIKARAPRRASPTRSPRHARSGDPADLQSALRYATDALDYRPQTSVFGFEISRSDRWPKVDEDDFDND